MTAAGLHCRHLLGQRPNRVAAMGKAASHIAQRLPSNDAQAADYYYWFHGTHAMRRSGGHSWSLWLRALRTHALAQQCRAGNALGSWDPVDVWGEDAGRVGATALLCLSLIAAFGPTGR
jgi:hypothetical protein